MFKEVSNNLNPWNIYLNKVLGTIRFNTNESTKFSPFYLLYNRDSLLSIENILHPRRKYSEEPHNLGIEKEHKAFTLVFQYLKRTIQRQTKYADKK